MVKSAGSGRSQEPGKVAFDRGHFDEIHVSFMVTWIDGDAFCWEFLWQINELQYLRGNNFAVTKHGLQYFLTNTGLISLALFLAHLAKVHLSRFFQVFQIFAIPIFVVSNCHSCSLVLWLLNPLLPEISGSVAMEIAIPGS
jgi:hypothetical protein